MIQHIAYYIACCTVLITLTIGFKIITEHKEKIYWGYYFLIPLFAFIMAIENYLKLNQLNTLTSFLFYFILYFLIYRRKWKKIIFYGITLWIFGVIIDIVAMVCSKFIPFLSILIIRSIYTLFLDVILLMVLKNRKLRNWLKSLYEKIEKVRFPLFQILLLITTLISLGYSLYFLVVEGKTAQAITCLYILIVANIALIILYINREYNIYFLKETNDYLIKNHEFYVQVVNDYHILKHNIIHQLIGIKSVSNKKTISLINDLIKQYNEKSVSDQYLKKMPMGINSVVYEKIYNFNNQELKLEIDNMIETNIFENLTSRSYNLLCEALGVLLDNALQASSKSSEQMIMLDMRETSSSYNIKIINTFNEILDVEKIGTLKYTTKKSGHGIGLFSLIGKKKVKVKTSIINNLFINEIIIAKKIN